MTSQIHIYHLLFSCPQQSWCLVKYLFESDSRRHKLLPDFRWGPFGNHGLQHIINTSTQKCIHLLGWTISKYQYSFSPIILTYKNDNFIDSTCYILEPNKSDLSPGRKVSLYTIEMMSRSLAVTFFLVFQVITSGGECAWQSGSEWTSFFCLQTSFVIFKTAVNIPLNGTASAQWSSHCWKKLHKGLEFFKCGTWRTLDIMVTVASQTSGTSAIYFFLAPQIALIIGPEGRQWLFIVYLWPGLEDWAKCNILRVVLLWNFAFGSCILAGI